MSYTAPPTPAGCLDSEEIERKLNETAAELERVGLEMLKRDSGGSGITQARANQILAGAVRARESAGKLAIRREDKAYSDWVVAEYRKLGGTAKDPRK